MRSFVLIVKKAALWYKKTVDNKNNFTYNNDNTTLSIDNLIRLN